MVSFMPEKTGRPAKMAQRRKKGMKNQSRASAGTEHIVVVSVARVGFWGGVGRTVMQDYWLGE